MASNRWPLVNCTCSDYPICTDHTSTIRAVGSPDQSDGRSRDRKRVGIQHHEPKYPLS